jgi:hypothetical protein
MIKNRARSEMIISDDRKLAYRNPVLNYESVKPALPEVDDEEIDNYKNLVMGDGEDYYSFLSNALASLPEYAKAICDNAETFDKIYK